jgi:hypothetical protein
VSRWYIPVTEFQPSQSFPLQTPCGFVEVLEALYA